MRPPCFADIHALAFVVTRRLARKQGQQLDLAGQVPHQRGLLAERGKRASSANNALITSTIAPALRRVASCASRAAAKWHREKIGGGDKQARFGAAEAVDRLFLVADERPSAAVRRYRRPARPAVSATAAGWCPGTRRAGHGGSGRRAAPG